MSADVFEERRGWRGGTSTLSSTLSRRHFYMSARLHVCTSARFDATASRQEYPLAGDQACRMPNAKSHAGCQPGSRRLWQSGSRLCSGGAKFAVTRRRRRRRCNHTRLLRGRKRLRTQDSDEVKGQTPRGNCIRGDFGSSDRRFCNGRACERERQTLCHSLDRSHTHTPTHTHLHTHYSQPVWG